MIPTVSIILPVFNGQTFLAEAIESCLNQTYTDFELIIVDDCSTDKSFEIARDKSLRDDRILITRNSENLKLPKTLNIGHSQARGSYITWTSDDNILNRNFLERLMTAIQNKDIDIAYSNYTAISNGQENEICPGGLDKLLFISSIGASFIYKKEVYQYLNGFDEDLFLVEDYDFWLRASTRFKFKYLPENLYTYRYHGESLTARIQSDPEYKRRFYVGLLKTYGKFKVMRDLKDNTIQFLACLHILDSKAFELFLRHNKSIIRDLEIIKETMMVKSNSSKYLYSKLFTIFDRNKNLKSAKNCIKIISRVPKIFLKSSYSSKFKVKVILSSLTNFLAK